MQSVESKVGEVNGYVLNMLALLEGTRCEGGENAGDVLSVQVGQRQAMVESDVARGKGLGRGYSDVGVWRRSMPPGLRIRNEMRLC